MFSRVGCCGSGKLIAEYPDGDTKVSQWQSEGKVRFASFNLGRIHRQTLTRDALTADVYFPAARDNANPLPSETINTSFADPPAPSYTAAAQLMAQEVWSAMQFMTSAFRDAALPLAENLANSRAFGAELVGPFVYSDFGLQELLRGFKPA